MKGHPGKGFPAGLFKAAARKIKMPDAANELGALRVPPANRLEAPNGYREGQYSVRINDQKRICFFWTEQRPADVEITDSRGSSANVVSEEPVSSR